MTFYLPVFANDHFANLSVFCRFPNLSEAIQANAKDRFSGTAKFGANQRLTLYTNLEKQDDDSFTGILHLRIEIDQESSDLGYPPTKELGVVTSQIQKFQGCRDQSAFVRGRFIVPNELLPKNGVIRAFLGLSTKAGNHLLTFRGAALAIDDCPLSDLSWSVNEDNAVAVTLEGRYEMTVGDSCLETPEKNIRSSFNAIVLNQKAADATPSA